MCCRFYMEEDPELASYFDEAAHSTLAAAVTQRLGKTVIASGEVRPTDIAAVLASGKDGSPRAFPMVWGFRGTIKNRPLINCRSETAEEKDIWRDPWKSHRCVIPATGYIEWERPENERAGKAQARKKYMVRPQTGALTYLAGLYRIEDYNGLLIPVFAVLTRAPAEGVRFLHDRMPLILPRDIIYQWIRPDEKPEQLLEQAVTELNCIPASSSV